MSDDKKESKEIKKDKEKQEPLPKGHMEIGGFLSNSKKVKQFSYLNEIVFKSKFMELYKKDPKANPYYKSEAEWEALFQKLIGVDFSKLKLKK